MAAASMASALAASAIGQRGSGSSYWTSRPPVVIDMEEGPQTIAAPAAGRAGAIAPSGIDAAAAPARTRDLGIQVGEVRIPIDDPNPPDKPGFFDLRLRAEQSARTEDVRRKALYAALSKLKEDQEHGPTGELIARIAAQLPPGDPRASELSKSYTALQEQLKTLEAAFKDFIDLRVRQKQSRFGSYCDPKTVLFGDTILSIALRSTAQAALLAGVGVGVQLSTSAILAQLVRNNASLIPQHILDRAAKTDGGAIELPDHLRRQVEDLLTRLPETDLSALAGMSDAQIHAVAEQIGEATAAQAHPALSDLTPEQLALARFEFTKPASSVLDAHISAEGLIYGTEAAYNFATSLAGASTWAMLGKQSQAQQLGTSMAFEREAPTSLERAGIAAKESAAGEAVAGVVGFIAGLTGNLIGKPISGGRADGIFRDIGAMAALQTFNSASNVGVEAFRTALLPKDKYGKCCQQAAHITLRTLRSVASQYLTTGLYALFNERPVGVGDHIRTLMNGGVGGLIKELLINGISNAASSQAPADQQFSRAAINTINHLIEVMRALNNKVLSELLSGTATEQERSNLLESLKTVVPPLREAASLTPTSNGIRQQWEDFDLELNEEVRRKAGPGPHNA